MNSSYIFKETESFQMYLPEQMKMHVLVRSSRYIQLSRIFWAADTSIHHPNIVPQSHAQNQSFSHSRNVPEHQGQWEITCESSGTSSDIGHFDAV